MISLMKLDFWLLRWGLLIMVLFAPIAGAFFYRNFSMTGLVLVFVMGLTLTQMDEKQKTRRFMLALPLPLKTFFQARTLAVISIGAAWVILESFGRMLRFGDGTFGELFTQATTTLATMVVLAPTVIAMITLLQHPVIKWGLTFFVYMVIIMIGTVFGAIAESFTYQGGVGYILSIVFLLLAVGVCWLILWIANRIRARVDVV
ncbi:hypothetical protein [Shouchella shacheensis]|uniref:hypothetical protein n=1 Tax=Shouchella shacheensis TaxID=1649580 RepID=UPI00073FDD73|nr:hypothetical protein [Shouchella shacheensis]